MAPSPEGMCVYKLDSPMTISSALRLADVIRQCRGKGTKRLKLLSPTGESLDGWMVIAGHPEVLVSEQEFYILARAANL